MSKAKIKGLAIFAVKTLVVIAVVNRVSAAASVKKQVYGAR